ncbi:MAG: periplasmic heavy metal sensor [Rhodobacteraceae bacterium]|nr:periplasmic heavy metal sensor [Paracoccaceae bacterium]
MTTEPKKTGTKRWVKILLVVSLGLNLMIVGVVVGVAVNGPPVFRAPQNHDAVGFLSNALPDQNRHQLRRELVDHRDTFRAGRNALRGLRSQMIEALQQEPFDIDQIEQLLKSQRGQFISLGELAHDALIGQIAELSPAERAEYVERLRRETRPRRPSN